jgi:DNA-binding FadR family transcriptional regulator
MEERPTDLDARAAVFTPVSPARISEVIVDQIKQAIHDGVFQPGDRLPPERDLGTRFGVSRMTVRDALRILESAGLVEIRVGARGGAFVRRPGSVVVRERLADMLAMSSLTATDLTEARRVLELEVVTLACERATEEDLDQLASIAERAERAFTESGLSPEYSAMFHGRLGEATHNRLLAMLVQALHDPVVRSVTRARHAKRAPGGRPLPDPYAEAQLRDHRRLIDALRARDRATARSIMEAHLQRTADQLAMERQDPGRTDVRQEDDGR